MRLLQEEAERQDVLIIDPAECPTATPRDYALVAFVEFPEVFKEAEHTSVFIAPPSVTEFDAGEDGIAASVTKEALEALRIRASGIFAADLRGKFCRVRDYVDDGELCIAVRHGAPPVSTEVIRGEEDEVIGFQEVDTAVISFVEATGRLTVWGCAKKRRGDLAEAFATEILGRPGIFKAASSQNLYTLAPVENSNGGFGFRIGDLDQIERVEITEAQANRVATNFRTGREKTLFSVRVKDSEGNPGFAAELFNTGTGWTALLTAPQSFNRIIGELIPIAGTALPPLCVWPNGQNLSRSLYAALFTALGTTYGAGDGSTTFGTPDLRGRALFGRDNLGGTAANRVTAGNSGIAGTTLGAAGGDERMPAHAHSVNDPWHAHGAWSGNAGWHNHGTNWPFGAATWFDWESGSWSPGPPSGTGPFIRTENTHYIDQGALIGWAGDHAHGIGVGGAGTGISIQNAGAGGSANMPPGLICNYALFAGV